MIDPCSVQPDDTLADMAPQPKRALEQGLNPLTCIRRHIECPVTGPDHGAAKALAQIHMRRVDTHEPVTARVLAQMGDAP